MLNNINCNYLYTGILYDNNNPIKKVIFFIKNNKAHDVFTNKEYSLDKNEIVKVDDIVELKDIIKYFYNKESLSIFDLYKIYITLLSNKYFINQHLDYFHMQEIEVGYKGKTEIVPEYNTYKSELYQKLIKIIGTEYIKPKSLKKK